MMTIRRLLVSVLCCMAGAALLAMAAAQWGVDGGPVNAARGRTPTLMRPPTPTKAPDEEGFIRRWLILEPIGVNGLTDSAVQAAVKKERFPNQFTVIPHDGDKVNVESSDHTWHAIDSKLYNVNLYHLASALKKPPFNVLF